MTDRIRRAVCLAAAALALSFPANAARLFYSGSTLTQGYTPGSVDLFDEILNAHSNDLLAISQSSGPDAFHVAAFNGQSSFGSLKTRSFVGTNAVQNLSNAFFSAGLGIGFDDTITIQGASSGFLSLDVDLHGVMDKAVVNGDLTISHFAISTYDTSGDFINGGDICMIWSDTNAPGFCQVSLAGILSPYLSSIAINPQIGGVVFQGHGSVLIPFFNNTFDISTSVGSYAQCHAPCSALDDYSHTLLIGGAKILDSSMVPIAGASLISLSGYDYQTPPASASSVPEPGTAVLMAAAFGFLMWRRGGKLMNRQILRLLSLAAIALVARADDDGRGFSASLQNCTELIGLGPVSFASARMLVPASYTLVPFGGSAGLVVRAARCESVRIGNSEARPAVVAQVGIAIVPPDGTGDINNYQLMYATSDPRLADALNEAGVPAVLDRALAYEFAPDASGNGEVYAAVSPTSTLAAWFLTGTAGLPPPGGGPVVANWWFNTQRRAVKMSTSIPFIGYGAASFSLHTSRTSPLGQLIGGNTDAAFVFFNARGVFTGGALTVTAR